MDKEKNEEQENLEIKELKLKISSLEKNKPYGLVWEEKNENVDSVINSNLPIFKELENRSITSNHENNNILINGIFTFVEEVGEISCVICLFLFLYNYNEYLSKNIRVNNIKFSK